MSEYKNIFEAVEKGFPDDVRHFVENEGVDVNATNFLGDRPLDIIIRRDSFSIATGAEILQYLISKGVNVNAAGRNGFLPLHCAIQQRQIEYVKILVSAGADVNALGSAIGVGNSKATALWFADVMRDSKIIEYIKRNGGVEVFKRGDSGGSSNGGNGCFVFLAVLGTSLTAGICGLVLFTAIGRYVLTEKRILADFGLLLY